MSSRLIYSIISAPINEIKYLRNDFIKRDEFHEKGKLHSAPVFGVEIEIEIEIESERQRWSRRAKNRAFDESITLSKF